MSSMTALPSAVKFSPDAIPAHDPATCPCPACEDDRAAATFLVPGYALDPDLTDPAEISPADRLAASALLNDGRGDFDADELTPIEVLVPPADDFDFANPDRAWLEYVGLYDDATASDADWDALYRERLFEGDWGLDDRVALGPSPDTGEPDDFALLPGRIG